MSCSEPVFDAVPSADEPVHRKSLRERRSGSLSNSKPLAGLSLDTLTTSREAHVEGPLPRALFRGWSTTEQGKQLPQQMPGSLVVMSYNILAQRYVTTDRYPHCNPAYLDTRFRSRNILDEIAGCEPDIICLQEISLEVYTEAGNLGDVLRRQRGYDSRHVVVTGKDGKEIHRRRHDDGTLAQEVRGEFEGVAIFFNPNRFTVLEEHPVRFNSIASTDRDLLPEERAKIQVASHNVCNVLVLEDATATVRTVYLIATLHAIWETSKPECQVYQLYHVLQCIEEMRSGYDDGATHLAVIVAGDFNAEPTGASIRYALGRRLVEPAFQTWGTVKPREHSLALRLAYDEYILRHPNKVSAMNPSTNLEGKVIDHVLYDNEALLCTMVGRLGDRAELPSAGVPSDHYPIAASFTPMWALR
jgi:mRNA deadenylase 3'-5' endonuclease subunit Ccr4